MGLSSPVWPPPKANTLTRPAMSFSFPCVDTGAAAVGGGGGAVVVVVCGGIVCNCDNDSSASCFTLNSNLVIYKVNLSF